MSGQENWTEIGGGNLVKWDSAKSIEGTYRGWTEVNGEYGKQKRFSVLTDDNELLDFYAPAILQRKLLDPRVTDGARVRIEYTGGTVATKTGRSAKEFVVNVAGLPVAAE
jgi:hypothetical protein